MFGFVFLYAVCMSRNKKKRKESGNLVLNEWMDGFMVNQPSGVCAGFHW